MIRTTSTIAAAALLALSGGLLATSAPQADAAVAHGDAKGRTVAQLNVRVAPTSQALQAGTFRKGVPITITCKVHGLRVGGNDIWYQLGDAWRPAYVSARYVTNVGALPHWCHGGGTTALEAPGTLRLKQAPMATAPTARTVAKGARATALCRVEVRQRKGDAQGWYYLSDGRWVAVNSIWANQATAPCH